MTDYTSIADSQVEPLSPVTSELMTAFRDNSIAIAEGTVGAPRVQADAMSGSIAGDVVLFKSKAGDVSGDDGSTPYVEIDSTSNFRATTSGSLRIVCNISNVSGGGVSARIIKNDVAVASGSSTFTVDVSFIAGDVIWVDGRAGSGAGGGAASGSFTAQVDFKTGAIRAVGGI